MLRNLNAAARSLRYWCTARADPVWPMTAYNALLHPAQWEDGSISQHTLSRNPVRNEVFKPIVHFVVDNWSRDLGHINLHSLLWAMTHFTPMQQQFLSERLVMKLIPHSVPPEIMDRLSGHLAALEAALLSKDPLMPNHLRESHRLLITYPETVHLLDDGEICKLIEGAVVYTKTEIVKAKASTKKAASKVTVDDL